MSESYFRGMSLLGELVKAKQEGRIAECTCGECYWGEPYVDEDYDIRVACHWTNFDHRDTESCSHAKRKAVQR